MFYEENLLREKLSCLNCRKRFDVPKLLPCGESICESCLSSLITASKTKYSLQCPFCKTAHSSKTEFTTQKLVLQMLTLRPVKVYRGRVHVQTELLVIDTENNLTELTRVFNNKIPVISAKCKELREQVANNKQQTNVINSSASLSQIEAYEQECYSNLNKFFHLVELAGFVRNTQGTSSYFNSYFSKLINSMTAKLAAFKLLIARVDIDEAKTNKSFLLIDFLNDLITVNKCYLSSILFSNKIIQLSETGKIDWKYYYEFFDAINIDRLRRENEKQFFKTINYKNNPYFNNDHLFNKRQEIQHVWISIFHNMFLIIFLQIRNQCTNTFDVLVKLLNSNGDLMCEACLNKKSQNEDESLKLIAVTNTNQYQSELNYFIVAIENCTRKDDFHYELCLLDAHLSVVSRLRVDYLPVLMYTSETMVFVLAKQVPFVHQIAFKTLVLVEHSSYGQNVDKCGKFYMGSNIMQIYSKFNDRLLYVCFDLVTKDDEEALVKVYSLLNGRLLRRVKLDLLDCFIYIDSLLRFLILNKSKQILCVYNEIEDDIEAKNEAGEEENNCQYSCESRLEKLYECKLGFIAGNISTFCIVNGYLLINDDTNRVIYVV